MYYGCMDLEVLIKSHNPIIAVETVEEARLDQILHEIAWEANLPYFVWDCNRGLQRTPGSGAVYKTADPKAAMDAVAEIDSGVFLFRDLEDFLQDHTVERKLRDLVNEFGPEKTVVFVARDGEAHQDIRELLVYYPLPLPSTSELREMLDSFIASIKGKARIELDEADTARILDNLRGLTTFEAQRALSQAVVADNAFDEEDVRLLANIKKRFIEKDNLVEYISPEDNFTVVGGLDNLKQWIAKRKVAFAENEFDLPAPKGVLMIGVPGCGKTLCARAIANELRVGLIKLDPGRLYNKYIGESEANLRKVLKMAESLAPVVLLVDEIEKVMPSGEQSASDAGLGARIFGTFLSWLQDKDKPVFVVATSNNIRALPPELTRKGRFDEIFFVDLPDERVRTIIFDIHLKRRKVDPGAVNVEELVALTEGFSGAEIEELILSALYSVAGGAGPLTTELLKEELKTSIPLSRRDAERIADLRAWAGANTIPA